jgi:hypothetical protein
MTIDERLEALAQSMEVLQGMHMDNDKRFTEQIRHLAVVAEQNEARVGELAKRSLQMMEAINRLAHIADIHDRRIERLER